MKTLVVTLALGALVGPALVPSARAQHIDAARERAIEECMARQNRDSHDPYDKRGGVQWTYLTCMAERGQPQ
jgi:hypothetical protein